MAEAEVHTLTGAYVCDALGPAERAAFEAHMTECPECASEVRELREVGAIMAAAVAKRPPDSLKTALDARIAMTRQAPPVTGDPSETALEAASRAGSDAAPEGSSAASGASRRRPRIRAAWAIAAALALLAAGLGWRTIDQQHRIDAQNAQTAQISQLLAAPDAATTRVPVSGGGSALILDSRLRNEVAVTFTGLPQVPVGKTYQLWLMAPDGKARSVGLMQTALAEPVLVEGLTGEADVGMTIEPSGGSAQPTTVPLMVAALGS